MGQKRFGNSMAPAWRISPQEVVSDWSVFGHFWPAPGTRSNRATGSNTVRFDGPRGPLAPPGSMGAAECKWDSEGLVRARAAAVLAGPNKKRSGAWPGRER